MSRMYGERIDARERGGRPIRFVWRGRLYTVLGVLEHWVVSREWWQRNDPDTELPPECAFWRVEATPGGNVPAAVYELRHDFDTERWVLVRIWD